MGDNHCVVMVGWGLCRSVKLYAGRALVSTSIRSLVGY